MTIKYTFTKAERLSRKKSIDRLFLRGKSFDVFPLKLLWVVSEPDQKFPVEVLISVSKKKFKKAVDRNRIKRKIREAYRLNKHQLYDILARKNKKILLAIIYTGREDEDFKTIENKIRKSFTIIDSQIF